jgi:cytochrome c
MRGLRLAVIFGVITLFVTSLLAFPSGDVKKGEALFHDQTFAGSTTGKSCNSCHINGKGLHGAGIEKECRIMGKYYKTLPEAVNYMIETAIHGKALNPESEEMVDIVAYINSL